MSIRWRNKYVKKKKTWYIYRQIAKIHMAYSSCSSSGLWQPQMVFSVNSCAWLHKLIYAFLTENITFEINSGEKVGKICRLRIKSPVFKTAKDSENEGMLTYLGLTRKVVIRRPCCLKSRRFTWQSVRHFGNTAPGISWGSKMWRKVEVRLHWSAGKVFKKLTRWTDRI